MAATPAQVALFQEHFRPRTDGGLDYTVEDHLHQIRQVIKAGARLGMPESVALRDHAAALGVPVGYLEKLRATMKRPKPETPAKAKKAKGKSQKQDKGQR